MLFRSITNYYDVVSLDNIETVLWLESDRMLSLDFSQRSLDVQKQVVIEEFKQRTLNQPYGDMSDLIKSLAYKVHPYRWSTIGKEISHISDSNLDQVRDFFKTYYAPDNAIIAIAGNISFEKTVELVEKWFGDIPSGNIKIKDIPQEPQQKEARFLEVERDVPQDAIVKAYHICGRTDEEYHCYDILSDVLSNGRSARLPQKLIMEKKLFSEVNAYISGSIDPGLFYVTGKPSEDRKSVV